MEDIDIGGVTLLRAAAKNHARVCVLSDPKDYAEFLQALDKGEVTEKSRQLYAAQSFGHTADYEATIADFFRKKYADGIQQVSLRYGESSFPTKYPPLRHFLGAGDLFRLMRHVSGSRNIPKERY